MIEIVDRETARIKQSGDLDASDLIRLEKLAKVYAILMSSHRENMKYGVFGNMDLEELDESVDGGGDGGQADNEGADEL